MHAVRTNLSAPRMARAEGEASPVYNQRRRRRRKGGGETRPPSRYIGPEAMAKRGKSGDMEQPLRQQQGF